MEFILATSNNHKAQEFAELFNSKIISIKAAEFKIEVDETGTSYYENALLKAQSYYNKFKVPVLADDSGLNVAAFPNELGIYSARFGEASMSDKNRAELLLERFSKQNNSDRSAYFTCVLCFFINPAEIFYFEGRLPGHVGFNYRGETGFGYDPIFIPSEYKQNSLSKDEHLTIAQLPEWKNDNSHRARAVKSAAKFFSEKLLPK